MRKKEKQRGDMQKEEYVCSGVERELREGGLERFFSSVEGRDSTRYRLQRKGV